MPQNVCIGFATSQNLHHQCRWFSHVPTTSRFHGRKTVSSIPWVVSTKVPLLMIDISTYFLLYPYLCLHIPNWPENPPSTSWWFLHVFTVNCELCFFGTWYWYHHVLHLSTSNGCFIILDWWLYQISSPRKKHNINHLPKTDGFLLKIPWKINHVFP